MDALGRGASHGQTHQWHYLKQDITSAVTECDCKGVAVESLTGFVLKLGNDQPTYGWLKLNGAENSAGATMAEVAKQLR